MGRAAPFSTSSSSSCILFFFPSFSLLHTSLSNQKPHTLSHTHNTGTQHHDHGGSSPPQEQHRHRQLLFKHSPAPLLPASPPLHFDHAERRRQWRGAAHAHRQQWLPAADADADADAGGRVQAATAGEPRTGMSEQDLPPLPPSLSYPSSTLPLPLSTSSPSPAHRAERAGAARKCASPRATSSWRR